MTNKKGTGTNPEKRLAEWSDKVSRRLIQVVAILLLIMALAQLSMQNDIVRQFLTSADRWEGTPLN
ncbi:MAG: hypothetical protein K0Q63_2789 [Paenibacillus sp.]|jgi:hypothetical protein|nr:hypothetical protein [Paenibacillus sp.]